MHEHAVRPAPTDAAQRTQRGVPAAPAAAPAPRHDAGELLRSMRAQGQRPLARALAAAVGQRTRAAVLARMTGIVDDPTDVTNQTHPGSGRGLHVENAGTPMATVHPTVQYGPLRNGCATKMEALLLPGIDDLGGSEPKQGTWPGWWQLAKPQSSAYWVRGHLLNHNIGGPGMARNLTPITKKCNSMHHNLVEKLCKAAAARGWAIAYTVEALYDATGPPLANNPNRNPDQIVWPWLATHLRCSWSFQDEDGLDKPGGARDIANTHG